MTARFTGVGVVSPAGVGVAALADRVLAGETLLAPDPQLGAVTGRVTLDLPAPRAAAMTALAMRAAMAQAGIAALDDETGVIFATTTGNMDLWEAALPRYATGELSADAFAPAFREHPLARPLGAALDAARGPVQVLTSACGAGTQALALAHLWLATGKVRRCLVGGVEVLTTLTTKGFGCLGLLSPDVARPFDRRRDGINLSEGAAFFCLEKDDTPDRPAACGKLLGGGTALDAFDLTRPHPEGRGLCDAVRGALSVAACDAREIEWIHAHGTGTPANDLAELAALSMLFPAGARPWLTSTKAIHGHALGASGLLETALALELATRGTLPPTARLDAPDPSLPYDRLLTSRLALRPRRILKTTLGFGGVNAAVVLAPGGVA